MATVRYEEAPGRLTVHLEGVLDIYAAKETCAALSRALTSTQPTLELVLGHVEEVDLAGVQVLHWLKASAQHNGQEVSVKAPSAAVRAAMETLHLTEWGGEP
jgi:anti-anti-sigma regulatory factor